MWTGIIGGAIGAAGAFIATMFYYRPIVAREKAIAEYATKDIARVREFTQSLVKTVDEKVATARKLAESLVIDRIATEYQKMKAGVEHKLDEILGKK